MSPVAKTAMLSSLVIDAAVEVHPEEIVQGPTEVINELKKKEEELIIKNQKLSQ